jgi:hypothetical protein
MIERLLNNIHFWQGVVLAMVLVLSWCLRKRN